MNPLILSLIGLVLVGVSANLLKLIKKNKILLLISILPCIYIFIYGLYATFGPIDLYKDGTENFIAQDLCKVDSVFKSFDSLIKCRVITISVL